MAEKNLLKRRGDLRRTTHLAPIEANTLAILSEKNSKGIGIAPVPALYQVLVEYTYFAFGWY